MNIFYTILCYINDKKMRADCMSNVYTSSQPSATPFLLVYKDSGITRLILEKKSGAMAHYMIIEKSASCNYYFLEEIRINRLLSKKLFLFSSCLLAGIESL